jgi:hypothetical protein
MEKPELEEGKRYRIFDCSINNLSTYAPEDVKDKIWNKETEYIPEEIPDIRKVHDEVKKANSIQKSGIGMDGMTIEEKVKKYSRHTKKSMLVLAGCAKENIDEFKSMNKSLEELKRHLYDLVHEVEDVQERLNYIKQLAL